jgi:hypothetical protein
MNIIIDLKIIYKEWYEKCEYRILKYEDPLLKFYSNWLLHVTLSLNFIQMGSCAKLGNKM